MSGGLDGAYADTGKPYEPDECFVRGLRCRAEEARFGGVVIELGPKT